METKKFYFSPSTGGFYHEAIHGVLGRNGAAVPNDAVEISEDEHAELLAAHYRDDQVIGAGHDGRPALAARPPLSAEEAARVLRTRRDRLLRESDWTQFPDSPLDEAQRAAWKVYRQALRDLPAAAQDPASPTFPQPPASA